MSLVYAMLVILASGQSSGNQDKFLPTWAYRSSISANTRVAAIKEIEGEIAKLAPGNPDAKRALDLLHKDVSISEPLGEDPTSSEAYRFILTPKSKSKHSFWVVPIYKADAKASRMIREFVNMKPLAYSGVHPQLPIVYLRVDGPKAKNRLRSYIIGINSRANQ